MQPAPDLLRAYLSEPCDECPNRATHNQGGKQVCNQHLNNSPSAPPAFARND